MSIYSIQQNYVYQQQQQLKQAQQAEKYNNSIADYNLQKVIKFYTQAINSADNSNDAKYLADALNGLLSQYGQSIDDVKGINNPLLTNSAAAGKKHNHSKGNAQDKAVIKDLNEEFGVKGGKDKDWLALAKKDENVRILDKDGKDVTNERNGEKLRGDILEVNSKKHGKVQISVGGDGVINGNDDKVISMGGKSAAEGIFHGLNSINNIAALNLNNVEGKSANPLFGGNLLAGQVDNPFETTTESQTLLTETEIKNLLAAILNSALSSIEKKEQLNQYKKYAA